MLKLYNVLTRKKEFFKPLKKSKVGLYTCGPTVYNYAHIGNLRTYIFEDILRRTLEYFGYEVKHVMNITDVGHLTSDADGGQDKMEKNAKTLEDVKRISKMYTEAFLNDLEELNIKRAHDIIPASEFIEEQKEIIKKLWSKGYAYDTPEAVYFDVTKFPNYGKLRGYGIEGQEIGVREEVVVDPNKRHSQDFALWFKRVGRFADHIQFWSSPWGEGFPRWHIEGSAISTKLLGQPFDIHTGGVDHIGTHHTNEIAQSEAAEDKPLADFWLHGEFLNLENAKMAKSGENFITLSTLKERGFDPLDFRFFTLQAKYRTPLQFSWEALSAAKKSLSRLRSTVSELKSSETNLENTSIWEEQEQGAFKDDMDFCKELISDDLNIPALVGVLQLRLRGEIPSRLKSILESKVLSSRVKLKLIEELDKILALDLLKTVGSEEVPEEIKLLVQKREAARIKKDWTEADAIRQRIESLGWTSSDTDSGTQIHKK